MPITLPPLSRRHFLQKVGSASLAWAAAPLLEAAESSSYQTWALFSDTHISADAAFQARGVCMAENLSRCVNQVLGLKQKPFGVLVNGDCAYLDGKVEDYSTFVRLVQPLREASVQIHCTLGNHDSRSAFQGALTSPEDARPLEGKHVSVLSTALSHWILLDSLDQVNQTPGLLGENQLKWLDRTLTQLQDKPTVVMTHHNLQGKVAEGKKVTGLVDSDALLGVLGAHPKVKALIYGHTHAWGHSVHEATGIRLVNLPPVAYVFGQERPNGWVEARIDASKLELELHALNPDHSQHREKVTIPW